MTHLTHRVTTAATSPRTGNRSRRRRIAFTGYSVLLLVIFALAYLQLIPTTLRAVPLYDSLGHLILLGIAAWLGRRAWDARWPVGPFRLPVVPLLVALTAAAEELAQALSTVRTASWRDLAMSLTGICLGTWLAGRRGSR